MHELTGTEIPMLVYTDFYSLHSTITKFQAVCEKRVSIYLAVLRQTYHLKEVTNFGFVRTKHMPADPLTKLMPCEILTRLQTLGKVSYPVAEYSILDEHDSTFDIRLLFEPKPE